MFNTDLNTQYSYSPPVYPSALPAPPLRRGALPFVPSSTPQFSHTDADMDGIITSGSVTAASCLGFGMQDETMDTIIDMDDAEEQEEGEERAEAEPKPASKTRKKKRAPNAGRQAPPSQDLAFLMAADMSTWTSR
ncbi:putative methionyl-tRNA synthetase [Hordeum vulgare]|nr:putative methionyl-tRNA synthetase [Hordeum vulgare]